MTLTTITRITTSHEHNLIARLFGYKVRVHYTMEGIVSIYSEDVVHGDFKDENGVVWNVFFFTGMSPEFTPFARLTTIRPQKELNVSMVFKKV